MLSRETRDPEKVAPVADVRSRIEPKMEPSIEARFEPRVERESAIVRAMPNKLAPIIPSSTSANFSVSISPAKEIANLPEVTEIPEVVVAPASISENLPERPNKREIRTKVIEPPELIVVEMTEEEQDVYSLIGISPLVLVDREVKDPRNVIVTVALPGQAPKAANNMGNLRVSAELAFATNSEANPETETEIEPDTSRNTEIFDNFSEITEPALENTDLSSENTPVKIVGSSNGVILRVNRALSVESPNENLEKPEFSEAFKEFVPIQSPEASRRKRSSASQA
jgi:ribonuclease E